MSKVDREKYHRQRREGLSAKNAYYAAMVKEVDIELLNAIDLDTIGEEQEFTYKGELFTFKLDFEEEPRPFEEFGRQLLTASYHHDHYLYDYYHDDDCVLLYGISRRGMHFAYECDYDSWGYSDRFAYYHRLGMSKNDARIKALESIRAEAEEFLVRLNNGSDYYEYVATVSHVKSGNYEVRGWISSENEEEEWARIIGELADEILGSLAEAYQKSVKTEGLFSGQ